MQKKELLLNYVRENGKNKTWEALAKQFGFLNGDAVRSLVKRKLGKVPVTIEENSNNAGNQCDDESIFYNLDKGELKFSHIWDHAPTPEEVIKHHKIDIKKWRLSGVWIKMVPKGYLTSALFSQLKQEDKALDEFKEFLKTYKSDYRPLTRLPKNINLSTGALVLNAQDAHYNKKDDNGENDIFDRFNRYEELVDKTLYRANSLCNLAQITYIIGSDEFNSESTGATVKGTPQVNILNYQASFQLICQHEVNIISKLLQYSDNVQVYYLIGNHDATVSFHLASWLQVYFKDEKRLNIDISSEFTKYFSIFDSSFCINHGDVQKPERLAQNFPIEYKQGFARSNYHYILTGDRHSELSRDIGGIKFYQIAALSKSRGRWDKQMGYTTVPAQMTSFLIEPANGISTIIKYTV